MSEALRAIDLYSGVGGWSLGLHLAEIDVCASYEIVEVASATNRQNNRHQVYTTDIRKLNLDSLPSGVDVVVGSPPCTQFSYSNRGGSGDLADGLEDVIRFLTIVDHLKPASWAMENVPRLAQILDSELREGGALAKFSHLGIKHHVFNMEDFGLPQKRRRCIVGNFDFDLLKSYASITTKRTLGTIVDALSQDTVIDPIYGHTLKLEEFFDNDIEEPLNSEEVRINHAAKALHPIYNSMNFPDPLDRAVRTVTATCTRVSRESIVIETARGSGEYRRLSIRERASAQGFPISFQFYGNSHGQKLKMVGNAIPPLFSYYLAHAIRNTPVCAVPDPSTLGSKLLTVPAPPKTEPHKKGFRYRVDRSFKFSIASLRLKSGVRFELNNGAHDGRIKWQVLLVFGTSKAIRQFQPRSEIEEIAINMMSDNLASAVSLVISEVKMSLAQIDVLHMQAVWSHTGPGATRPFMLLDLLNNFGGKLIELFEGEEDEIEAILLTLLHQELGSDITSGTKKLLANAPTILAGLIVGSCANTTLLKRDNPINRDSPASKRRSAN